MGYVGANLLVVPPFLRRGNLRGLRGCKLACGANLSAMREFVGVAWVLSSHF